MFRGLIPVLLFYFCYSIRPSIHSSVHLSEDFSTARFPTLTPFWECGGLVKSPESTQELNTAECVGCVGLVVNVQMFVFVLQEREAQSPQPLLSVTGTHLPRRPRNRETPCCSVHSGTAELWKCVCVNGVWDPASVRGRCSMVCLFPPLSLATPPL